MMLFCINSNAQDHLFGPKNGCKDASKEVSINIENIGQTQRIHLINISSKALLIKKSYSYGNIRNRISELSKVLPGEETIFRIKADGNWYAIVIYLNDACKSCPNNSKSDQNESNNWDLKCTWELDKELCKKYFNNCD